MTTSVGAGVTRARVLEVAVWCAVITVLELLNVSTVTKPEVVAALGIGLVAGAGATAGRAAMGVSFRPRVRWLAWLVHLPVAVVRDTAGVFAAAATGRTGSWRTVPTGAAGVDSRARAHRAFMVLTWSTAPSSIVVNVDPDSGYALIHEYGAGSKQSALERAVTA